MELRRGQITVIVGRSGSGKTSLLSVVLGVGQPTRGVVERFIDTFGCAPQTAAFADQQSVAANIDLVRSIRSQPPVEDGRRHPPHARSRRSGRPAGRCTFGRRTSTAGRGARPRCRCRRGGARRADIAARPRHGTVDFTCDPRCCGAGCVRRVRQPRRGIDCRSAPDRRSRRGTPRRPGLLASSKAAAVRVPARFRTRIVLSVACGGEAIWLVPIRVPRGRNQICQRKAGP